MNYRILGPIVRPSSLLRFGGRGALLAMAALFTAVALTSHAWGQATKTSDKKDAAKADSPEARALAAPDDPSKLPPVKPKATAGADRKPGDPFADEPTTTEKTTGKTTAEKTSGKSAPKSEDDPFATTPAKGKLDSKVDTKTSGNPFSDSPTMKKGETKSSLSDPFRTSDTSDSKTPAKSSKAAPDLFPGVDPAKTPARGDNPFEDDATKPADSKPADTKPAEAKAPDKTPRSLNDQLSDTKSTEPEPTPGQAELKHGQELLDAGKYKEAIEPLKKSIKLTPAADADAAHYTLGVAYRMLNQYDDAIEEFSAAVKLNTAISGDAFLRRGVCWYYKDEYALAQADFDDAAGGSTNDPRPMTWKGMTLVRLGQLRDAINAYSEALRYDNHYAPAHVNRGLAYIALKEYDKAVADFDQAIRSTPKDAALYFKRGVAQGGLGDWPGAVRSYSEAIRINPKYAEAYTNRSLAYRRIGDSNKAQADLQRSLQLKATTDRMGQSAAR